MVIDSKEGTLFQAIVDNAREMIILLDTNGRIIFVNKYVEEITGLDFDFWVGSSYESAVLADDLLAVKNMFKKTLEGNPISFETRIFGKNMNVIWLNIDASLMETPDGTTTVICFARDITNRKQNEHYLDLFKKTLDCSTNAVGIASPEGKHWYQNRAFDKLFGLSIPEPPELYRNKDEGLKLFKKLKSGSEFHGEVEMYNRDGEIISVMIHAFPLKDSEGNLVGLAGIHSDITTLRESQKRLQESEALYQNIFETSLAGLWRTRLSDGKFLKANHTTADYLGFSSTEEILKEGRALDLYQNPEDRNDFIRELKKNGIVTEYHLPFVKLDGSRRDFLVSAQLFSDKGYIEGVVTDITAQKQAEKALLEIEKDLRITLNSIGDAVIATDIKGNIVRMNPSAEKLTGYSFNTNKKIHLSSVFQIIDDKTGKPHPDPVQTILKTGNLNNFPVVMGLIKRNGNLIQIANSGNPIQDTDGNVTGVVLVFRDLTDEHQLKANLRFSRERFMSIANLIPVGLFECDTEFNISFANSAGLEMFGVAEIEIVNGLNGLDMFTEASRRKAKIISRRRVQGENIKTIEYDCIRKNGEQFSVIFYVNSLFNDVQEHIGFRGAMLDITERKRTEAILRESEEFSSSLLKNSPHAISVLGENYLLKYVNPAFEKLTGFSKAEILGLKPPYPWWPENNQEKIRRSMEELLHGKINVTEELFVSKSGKQFWVEASSSKTLGDNGCLNNYICNWVEITNRKSMEKELRKISLHDALTGLYNRTFFEKEIKRFESNHHRPVSIVVCDIDGLKLINETMGHQMGDELLKTAAQILTKSFRTNDIVARTGGDEFTVILPNTRVEETLNCCKHIREQLDILNSSEMDFHLSISVGYACCEEDTEEATLRDLYKIADHNMYREKLQQSHSSRSDIVQALIKTMEVRDRITNGHADRLYDLSIKFGKKLNLSDVQISDLKLLCRFHDLGKVGIPDSILFKPEKLTTDEYTEIQTHCEIGYRIALTVSDLAPIADQILKHHEWWNGQGYPLGLVGEDIPIESRILAIIDAYDAMINIRPYKGAMSQSDAINELRLYAGKQFDPDLVKTFIEILES